MENVKLSNIELGLLTLGFLYGSSAISNPAMEAKRDAWFALILSWIIGSGFILMTLYISKLNNGKCFTEILYSCFGEVLGKFVTILYILFFLYKAAINTGLFGMFMAAVSYPETPFTVIMGVFLIAVIYVVRCGLGTLGKISEILVPLIPLQVLIVAISIVTMKNYSGFQPMFLEIAPIIRSIADVISNISGDFIVFLMILPYTNDEKGRLKAAFCGFAGVGFILIIIVIRNLKVIGPELIENFIYPAHVAAQLIPYISIDPLIDLNLLLGEGFKVSVFLYAASKAIGEFFNLDNHKSLVCAIATLVIVIADWLIPNGVELKRWISSWAIFIWTAPFQLVFPLAMLIISAIKSRKGTLENP